MERARAHGSGGTTQGAEVVRASEWVGARVGTGIAFSNLAEAAWCTKLKQEVIELFRPCVLRTWATRKGSLRSKVDKAVKLPIVTKLRTPGQRKTTKLESVHHHLPITRYTSVNFEKDLLQNCERQWGQSASSATLYCDENQRKMHHA